MEEEYMVKKVYEYVDDIGEKTLLRLSDQEYHTILWFMNFIGLQDISLNTYVEKIYSVGDYIDETH